MKKRSIALSTVVLLLALTACAAVWHLSTRTVEVEGGLGVTFDGQTAMLKLEDLALTHVEGQVVNGKGETKEINSQGILLADALTAAGISPESIEKVTVIASDEYRAELSGDEVRQPDTAWLIRQSDSASMVVFGDPNSKRNVNNVVRLEVE